jgi:uncharacterized membrane protein
MKAAAAIGALLGSWALTLWAMPWSDERITDLFIYKMDAHWFLDGRLPYQSVPFEYPPLAALPLWAAGLPGTGFSTYRGAFAVLMLALAVCVLLLVGALARRTGGNDRLALAAVALAPLVTGALIRNHFDLLPVAMLLAALLLLISGRTYSSMAVLGVATMTKGFPLVIAPVALAWLVARGERREAVRGAAALAAVIVAFAGATVALSPSGALHSLRYQTSRPVQIESLPSLVVRAVDPDARTRESYRSHGLVSPANGIVAAACAALGVAVVALLSMGAARARDPRSLVLASLAAVTAFAAFGKVLSPQYLIWVLPLGALALSWRRWTLAAAVGAATLLTFLEFPSHYFRLVSGHSYPLVLVALRDVVLLGVIGLAIRELVPLRRPAAGPALST